MCQIVILFSEHKFLWHYKKTCIYQTIHVERRVKQNIIIVFILLQPYIIISIALKNSYK